jgi:hypothetical protein
VALERVIRQHSEQWFLFHDRWDIESDRALATAMAFGTAASVTPIRSGQESPGNVSGRQGKTGA